MTKFSDLKLDPKVLTAIAEAGYENPTPIQQGAIPPALEGRDVLGIAQTGTGKTASFTLPMITLLGRGRARARMPRSLVLCPTRELAAQVAENFDIYAKNTRLTKALLIGGVSFGEQDKLIDRGVDVLIATPGRLLDHFERGKLLLTGVQIMVVDEADRMLDMGFIPDIERIFQLTPFTRQTLFFSATMAPEIERITNTFLHSPERIEVARQATASETITQRLVQITPTRRDQTAKQKRELLRSLIDAEGSGLKNAIIFCNRKTDVDIVAKSLAKHGYDAAPIHGDLDQSHRTRTLDSFRDGSLKLLIASDVAARGLDIPAVSHVFNFDLPSHAEDYVHRIGRTGRAGRQGTAISIGTPSDDKYLSAIENLVKQSLPRGDTPKDFSLSDNAKSEPRKERDDRKGGRDKRRRGRRDDEQSQDSRPQEARGHDGHQETGQSKDVAKQDPLPDTKPEAEQPKQQRQEPRREERRDDRRDDRRRGRGRDDHRGPAVMGMGDHVPEFMLVSLRPAGGTSETDVHDADEAPAEQTDAPKPTRSKSRRGRKSGGRANDAAKTAPDQPTDDNISADTETTAQTSDTAASPQAPDGDLAATTTDAGADTPKPKRSRSRSKKPAAADEAGTVDSAEGGSKTAAKPRASRSRKAKNDDVAAAPVEESEPKPKRTRRKKVEDGAEAATDAEKPKRTRRKKADAPDAAADQPADAAAEPRGSADAEA